MKNILAIDTATKILAITLFSNNKYNSIILDEGFTHSERLLPSIDQLLNDSHIKIKDIDLLVCTRGPGSFTGLRIGMSTLKGISTALSIPLVSVPTLDIYAYSKKDFKGIVLPIIDARKKSYYTAIFKNGTKKTKDLDLSKDKILKLVENNTMILLTGPDAFILYDKCSEISNIILDKNQSNNYTVELIDLGLEQFKINGPDDRDQGPVYIRKSEAQIHLENKKSN